MFFAYVMHGISLTFPLFFILLSFLSDQAGFYHGYKVHQIQVVMSSLGVSSFSLQYRLGVARIGSAVYQSGGSPFKF